MTVIRRATAADVDAVADLEATCLGIDAWSRGLVEQGVADALPTVSYLVAEVDGTVVGHAVASAAGDLAELQRMLRTAEAIGSVVAVDIEEAVDEPDDVPPPGQGPPSPAVPPPVRTPQDLDLPYADDDDEVLREHAAWALARLRD